MSNNLCFGAILTEAGETGAQQAARTGDEKADKRRTQAAALIIFHCNVLRQRVTLN